MKLTLIVGSGRCGSTMLSRILHQHPGVLSVSEFISALQMASFRAAQGMSYFPSGELDGRELWRLLAAPVPYLDTMLQDGLRVPEWCYPYDSGRFGPVSGVPLLCHSVLPGLTDDPDRLFDELAAEVPGWPNRPAAQHYCSLFAFLARKLGRRVIVERSGGSLLIVRQLRRAFPEARFVYMHRSGPDTALSWSRFAPSRIMAISAVAAAAANLPPGSAPETVVAAVPELKGVLASPYDAERIMAYPVPPEIFGRRWSSMTCTGLSALRKLPPGTWAGLRYEDLLGPGLEAELTRLAEFIGVRAPAPWLAAARSMIDPARAGSARAQLDAESEAALRAACDRGEQAVAATLRTLGQDA